MSSAVLEGSCLCGAMRYRISGTPVSFNHCYCSRCRKSSGTGHASNIILKLDAAEWLAGQAFLGAFKVPDAERFGTAFCKQCGSQMPRVREDAGYAVVPAGTLDSAAPLQPTDRIMWSSRADWACDDREIPTWDEYRE